MPDLYASKRNHSLHLCASPDEFCARFAEEARVSVIDYVSQFVSVDNLLDILLAGSIPLGAGSCRSDVDFITLLRDAAIPSTSARGTYTQKSFDGTVVVGGVVSVVHGIECDVEMISHRSTIALQQDLKSGRCAPNESEVRVLTRLRQGWRLGPLVGIRELRGESLLDAADELSVYCSTRDFVRALKYFEDATAAVPHNPAVATHLGRLAVEAACRSYLASKGHTYPGAKWLRLIPRAGAAGEAFASLDALLFTRLCERQEELTAYVNSVNRILSSIRQEICRELRYRIAFNVCPLIYGT